MGISDWWNADADADADVYYDEPAELASLTPRPDRALDLLRDLLVDFPFADEASRQ